MRPIRPYLREKTAKRASNCAFVAVCDKRPQCEPRVGRPAVSRACCREPMSSDRAAATFPRPNHPSTSTSRGPMKRLLTLLMLLLSTPALAQEQAKASGSTGVDALRAIWEQQSGYVLRSAEQMPEADYAFKPVATVRTFGQQIAHVAGAQYSMCASALGEPAKDEDEIEKTMTTKAQLVAALRASSE